MRSLFFLFFACKGRDWSLQTAILQTVLATPKPDYIVNPQVNSVYRSLLRYRRNRVAYKVRQPEADRGLFEKDKDFFFGNLLTR